MIANRLKKAFYKLTQHKIHLWQALVVAIAYWGASLVAVSVASLPGDITPVWPASGVALAAVLVWRKPALIGIALGRLAYYIGSNGVAVLGLLNAFTTIIAVLVGVSLGVHFIRYFAKSKYLLDRPQDVFYLIIIGALLSTTLNPLVGSTTLCLTGLASWSEFSLIFVTWWISDAMGVLVFTPALIAWSEGVTEMRQCLNQRWLEAIALLFIVSAISRIAFGNYYPVEYMLIPTLMWAAFRFKQAGATLLVVIVSIIAIIGTAQGFGSFVRHSQNEALLLLQSFVGVIALTTLILSAIITESEQKTASLKATNQSLNEARYDLLLANEELENRVEKRTAELRKEKEKSEELLLNILPKIIAEKLKNSHETLAQHFDEVTILFADIVGFTPLSARMQPLELVHFLNQIFSAFDRLAEKHGLEKIKTIGDAYMVVGGLPVTRADHAEAVADMALEMQACMSEISENLGELFEVRIGINTGPVIAGVIGIKKFIYDLWGDTVNVASRMESHGIPGGIQVTAMTYERLKDKYIFESRGRISVKGKGEMMTYLLVKKRVGSAVMASGGIVR